MKGSFRDHIFEIFEYEAAGTWAVCITDTVAGVWDALIRAAGTWVFHRLKSPNKKNYA